MMNSWVTTIGAVALGAAWMLPVRIADAQMCVGDGNADNQVTIEELVSAVGNALEGCGFSTGMVTLSGVAPSVSGESYRIWASGDRGTAFHADSDPDTGHFTMLVDPNDWYTMGFGHFHGHAEMHFAGHMVFDCGDGEDDHFFVSAHDRNIDVGMMSLNDDGSFAQPERNPLEQLDHDGDGMHDIDDPDIHCEDVGDDDHDGFYDDDMDHDGFHDDDMDHDGHPDGGHHGPDDNHGHM